MESCTDISPLVTRVADEEASAAERGRVDGHVRECAPCRMGLHAERQASRLVRDHARALVGHAPLGLRSACAAMRPQAGPPARRPLPLLSRARWPMALAATLVIAVAGSVLYGLAVNPSKAAAAQLTLDHLKCFTLFEERSGVSAADAQAAIKASLGLDIVVPSGPAAGGFTLVGGRRCLYSDGSVAHLLYRRGALRVSLFVLPTGARLSQTDLDVLGHSVVAFDRGGRTWVVLGRAPHAEMDAIAAVFSTAAE